MRAHSSGTPTTTASAISGPRRTRRRWSAPRYQATTRSRDGEPHGVRQRVDVPGGAGDQVAGAGALDRRQRQRDDPLHELLAQLGEHLLAEDEGLPARGPGDPVCTSIATASTAASRSTVPTPAPARTSSTSRPSSAGPASPASAANACRPTPAPGRGRAGARAAPPRGGRWPAPRPAGWCLTGPPRGRRCAGRRRWWRAARGGCPRRPLAAVQERTWSTWSSSSGLAVMTTVVRPARCARSRSAIRASVCASTALVGSTSTSVGRR